MNPLFALALAVSLVSSSVCTSLARAATVEIAATTPSWSNAVGGVGVAYNTTNGAFTDVRWGENIGNGKSGLGFDPTNPPATTYLTDVVFKLGDLRHYNNAIGANSASSSVDLSLTTSVTSAVPSLQTFSFRFFIDETNNVAPCAYPSVTPCADRITFQNLDLTSAFTIEGTAYTMALIGFSVDGGTSFKNDFISQEGGTNVAGLYASITAAPVPEPATYALLLGGLGLLGFAGRQRT